MNLIDVARELGTEEQCLAYVEKARWPNGVCCIKCGGVRASRIVTTSQSKSKRTRLLYECLDKDCGHQFSVLTGTLFHDTHLPLPKWFMALALFCDAKKSVSALQMQRHIGVAYKTAWYLCHRIRKAMEEAPEGLFDGTVEVDEMHVSGKYDKRRKRGPWETKIVMGVLERGENGEKSKVRTQPITITSKATLTAVVRNNVSPKARLLCTDQLAAYKSLAKDYTHSTVNHGKEEYVRGEVHTNSIEGVWSLFNRSLVGQFHSITIKHMPRYLAELDYKFNRRGGDFFPETVSNLTAKDRMRYKDLVSDPSTEPSE
jgi:transposase-like protein